MSGGEFSSVVLGTIAKDGSVEISTSEIRDAFGGPFDGYFSWLRENGLMASDAGKVNAWGVIRLSRLAGTR